MSRDDRVMGFIVALAKALHSRMANVVRAENLDENAALTVDVINGMTLLKDVYYSMFHAMGLDGGRPRLR